MRKSECYKWIRAHLRTVTVAILFVLVASLWVVLYKEEHRGFTVAFLDVGQGDAVFIEAPNGNQLLYDAGPPSGKVLSGLAAVMPFWDRSIDVAVLSHPDMDHIGGFPDVFRRYAVTLELEPGVGSDNGAYQAVESAVTNEHSAHFLAREGMRIELGGGAYAEVLYPDRDVSTMDTNDASVVLRVVYKNTAVLLSGDLPKNIEDYVAAKDGDRLHVQILKLGHHGSRTSTSEYWLNAVSPEVAIVSAGKDNRYGHPHKEVIELLDRLHIPHPTTFEEGNIVFESDGDSFRRI